MKVIYSAQNISLVSVIQSIIEGEGINCWVRNQYLYAGMGEIPPIECWPQLCVDDEDYARARSIVEEAMAEKDLAPWRCPSCGEELEGQFSECWKCGKGRP
ncbi:DUF2007 domain-containing protein [Geomonas sp. RF6]|uniref:putative signal transducing protein n=1 Tax=Geomonas sp. RF6 TaxID=2897342 RepID=UPI001E36DDDD|nr:DUF2007 domain-containing protein [Geomonas sp. RF6]UFS69538.1 DUF2007 domain-containing protein [Geomonas sp. RF6]